MQFVRLEYELFSLPSKSTLFQFLSVIYGFFDFQVENFKFAADTRKSPRRNSPLCGAVFDAVGAVKLELEKIYSMTAPLSADETMRA